MVFIMIIIQVGFISWTMLAPYDWEDMDIASKTYCSIYEHALSYFRLWWFQVDVRTSCRNHWKQYFKCWAPDGSSAWHYKPKTFFLKHIDMYISCCHSTYTFAIPHAKYDFFSSELKEFLKNKCHYWDYSR